MGLYSIIWYYVLVKLLIYYTSSYNTNYNTLKKLCFGNFVTKLVCLVLCLTV